VNFFFAYFVDIPTFLVFLVVLFSWRSPVLVRKLKAATSEDKGRQVIWTQFGKWFLDVFFVPFGIVVLVTVYRAPHMIRKVILLVVPLCEA
jgi:hypothetical protein